MVTPVRGPSQARSGTPSAVPAPTFVDPAVEARFAVNGYVVVPFLDAAEVASARAVHSRHHPVTGVGMEVTFRSSGLAERAQIAAEVEPLLRRPAERTFCDHRLYMAGFITKWPGADSAMDTHQDLTHVDEDRFRSVSLWVALDDVDPASDNGVIEVLPGSQCLDHEQRGLATRNWYEDHAEAELAAAMVPVPVRAGWAVALDSAVLHRSRANRTDRPRRVLAVNVAPRAAQLVLPVACDGDEIELLAVDEGFWTGAPM